MDPIEEIARRVGTGARRAERALRVTLYDEHGTRVGYLKAPGRRIKLTDKQGRVTGEMSHEEWLRMAVLVKFGPLLVGTTNRKRPLKLLCPDCTLAILDVPRIGRMRQRCPDCERERHRCTEILASGEICGKPLRKDAFAPRSIRRRRGKPPVCRECATRTLATHGPAEAASKANTLRDAIAKNPGIDTGRLSQVTGLGVGSVRKAVADLISDGSVRFVVGKRVGRYLYIA